jgi:transketolase
MRNMFAKVLTQMAAADDRVVMLSADIGNRLFDDFKTRFPDRFYNCGVAEANMIGMAAGLAANGLRPICYTITPFVTTRCLEQIRVDLCYHHLPVIVAGVGSGLGYAELGATHHACEDIAMLRVLPGMTVVCPADPVELKLAMLQATSINGPVYLRLGKKGEPVVHAQEPAFTIGQSLNVKQGKDVCLLSTGTILPVVMQAAESLESQGISCRVESFHTIKPLDEKLLARAFHDYRLVVTIEEHSIIGGLGAAAAEWYVDQAITHSRLLRIGTPDAFLHESTHYDTARQRCGLTVDNIASRIAQAWTHASTSPSAVFIQQVS